MVERLAGLSSPRPVATSTAPTISCSQFGDVNDSDIAYLESLIIKRTSLPLPSPSRPLSDLPQLSGPSYTCTDYPSSSILSPLPPCDSPSRPPLNPTYKPPSPIIASSPTRSPQTPFIDTSVDESLRDTNTTDISLEPIRPLFNDSDFPPLVLTSTPSPVGSPSFADPTLQKSLNIFTDKTPQSPSVLPLESIRF